MNWIEILISAVIGNVIGGAITFVVSRFFYMRAASDLKQAAQELKQEARELKQQTQLIMRALREGLDIELTQDARGNIIGVGIKARAHIGGSSDVSATPTERDENEAPVDRDPHP